jgi:hypothetical protein
MKWNKYNNAGSRILLLERCARLLELRCKCWKQDIFAGTLWNTPGTPL